MSDLVITAIGQDQPGIVASVTKVLLDAGCNLADCSMTRLSDQFAMILLVDTPAEVGAKQLQEALSETGGSLDLSFQVREAHQAQVKPEAVPYVASLYGADKPGIVNKVATGLSERSVNITNLLSHIAGQGLYTVILELDVPTTVDPVQLKADLAKLAIEMGVELTLRPAEAAEL